MRSLTLLLFFLSRSVFSTTIAPTECIKKENDAGDVMYVVMSRDLKLDDTVFDMKKTKAEIIAITPVNHPLALMYGEAQKQLGGVNSEDLTTAEEFAQGFMDNNAKNIIVKYTYEDKQGRRNIFLASTFVSDVDCIVRFNGYIIVQREF